MNPIDPADEKDPTVTLGDAAAEFLARAAKRNTRQASADELMRRNYRRDLETQADREYRSGDDE